MTSIANLDLLFENDYLFKDLFLSNIRMPRLNSNMFLYFGNLISNVKKCKIIKLIVKLKSSTKLHVQTNPINKYFLKNMKFIF